MVWRRPSLVKLRGLASWFHLDLIWRASRKVGQLMSQAADSTWDQFGPPYGHIMARAWTDPAFKQRLRARDP